MKSLVVFGILTLASLCSLGAQTPSPVPAAPVPAAIAKAKTVFISNRALVNDLLSGGHTRAYDEFYAALAAKNRYQILDDPAGADLVLELEALPADRYVAGLEGIRVTIYDAKSHYVLWALVSPQIICTRKATCDKNFTQSMVALADDLVALGK